MSRSSAPVRLRLEGRNEIEKTLRSLEKGGIWLCAVLHDTYKTVAWLEQRECGKSRSKQDI